MNKDHIKSYWQAFLEESGLPPETKYYACEYFGNEEIADELLALIQAGTKTATCGCKLSYDAEGERLPQAGDLSVVTNFAGEPGCVIRTTKVTVLPFNEVTWDMARLEDEDSELQAWVDGHRRFFELEAVQYGFSFTDTTPVVFEEFEVIYQQ